MNDAESAPLLDHTNVSPANMPAVCVMSAGAISSSETSDSRTGAIYNNFATNSAICSSRNGLVSSGRPEDWAARRSSGVLRSPVTKAT